MRKQLTLCILTCWTFASLAATCPGSETGKMRYSSGEMEFCDGSDWISTKGSSLGSCSAGNAGKMEYNASTYRFCDGSNWYSMKGSSLGSCTAGDTGKVSYASNLMRFCDGSSLWNMTAAPPMTLSFVSDASNSSGGTSRTYSAQNIGTAAADRLVVVIVSWGVFGSRNLSSMTIGGVSATIATQNDGTNIGQAIAYATVTSGTSADIVVNFSGWIVRSAIAVYRLTGLSSTNPTDTASPGGGGGTTRSLTIDIPTGGGGIFACATGGESSQSWTNATQDGTETITDHHSTVASSTTAGTSQSISSGTSCRVITGASWL